MLSRALIVGRNGKAQKGLWWRPYARELAVEQWEDGLGVRLPSSLATRIGLAAGDVLHVLEVYPGGMTVHSSGPTPYISRLRRPARLEMLAVELPRSLAPDAGTNPPPT
jgi:hypothetical protein